MLLRFEPGATMEGTNQTLRSDWSIFERSWLQLLQNYPKYWMTSGAIL